MDNNGWYQDDKGNWKVKTREVKRQIEEVKNKKSLHKEAISAAYNPETDNIVIVTSNEITYIIPVNSIEELKKVPKRKLSDITLYSVPDSAVHIESLDINILVDSLIQIGNSVKSQAV